LKRFRFILVLLVLAACSSGVSARLWAAEVSTLSFCPAGARATFPGTLAIKGEGIVVDLSGLPAGTKVFRAVLQVRRDPPGNSGRNPVALKRIAILDTEGRALALRGPRYQSFEATEAVRTAMREGRRLVLRAQTFPRWKREATRLDVTCSVAARTTIKPVAALRVRHLGGQTFITWKDPYPHLARERVTIQELREARAKADAHRQVRFRIYRSKKPITTAAIGEAEPVDEVDGFTAWNGEYYGVYPKPHQAAFRYVVWAGEGSVPPDTGVYVHKPADKGTAYYAVSVALNGEEDFTLPIASKAVEEQAGPGVPVLQRTVKPKAFVYVRNPTIRYYVKWESPPVCKPDPLRLVGLLPREPAYAEAVQRGPGAQFLAQARVGLRRVGQDEVADRR